MLVFARRGSRSVAARGFVLLDFSFLVMRREIPRACLRRRASGSPPRIGGGGGVQLHVKLLVELPESGALWCTGAYLFEKIWGLWPFSCGRSGQFRIRFGRTACPGIASCILRIRDGHD